MSNSGTLNHMSAVALALTLSATSSAETASTAPAVKQVQLSIAEHAKACAKPMVGYIDDKNVRHLYDASTQFYQVPEGDRMLVIYNRVAGQTDKIATNSAAHSTKTVAPTATSDKNVSLQATSEAKEFTIPLPGAPGNTGRIDFTEPNCDVRSLPLVIVPRNMTTADAQNPSMKQAIIDATQYAKLGQHDQKLGEHDTHLRQHDNLLQQKPDRSEVELKSSTKLHFGFGGGSVFNANGGNTTGALMARLGMNLAESKDGHRFALEFPTSVVLGRELAVADPPLNIGYSKTATTNTQTIADIAALLTAKFRLGDYVSADIGAGLGGQFLWASAIQVGDRFADKQGWQLPSQPEGALTGKGKAGLTVNISNSRVSPTFEVATYPTVQITSVLDKQGDASKYGGQPTGRTHNVDFPVIFTVGGQF